MRFWISRRDTDFVEACAWQMVIVVLVALGLGGCAATRGAPGTLASQHPIVFSTEFWRSDQVLSLLVETDQEEMDLYLNPWRGLLIEDVLADGHPVSAVVRSNSEPGDFGSTVRIAGRFHIYQIQLSDDDWCDGSLLCSFVGVDSLRLKAFCIPSDAKSVLVRYRARYPRKGLSHLMEARIMIEGQG